MNANKSRYVLPVIASAAIIGVWLIVAAAYAVDANSPMEMGKKSADQMMGTKMMDPNEKREHYMHKSMMACNKNCQETITQCDMAIAALRDAASAIDAGDTAKAKDGIAKAEKNVTMIKQSTMDCMKKMPTANMKCPMTGMTFDTANLPESRTRMYKGMKIGFCSDACPAAWDKLTDAEKDAKLAEVMPKKTKTMGEKMKSMMMEKGEKEMKKQTY